jgi:hypothetical protein
MCIDHRRPGDGLIAANNTGRAQNIPSYSDFLSRAPSCPNIFSDCASPKPARGIGVKRRINSLRGRGIRREQDLPTRRASEAACQCPLSGSELDATRTCRLVRRWTQLGHGTGSVYEPWRVSFLTRLRFRSAIVRTWAMLRLRVRPVRRELMTLIGAGVTSPPTARASIYAVERSALGLSRE